MKKFGIKDNNLCDVSFLLSQWMLKFIFLIVMTLFSADNIYVYIAILYWLVQIYITIEIFMAFSYLINRRIYYLNLELR